MSERAFETGPVQSDGGVSGHLIVVSGPSGVGKDTLIELLRHRDATIAVVVTATTRAPREAEVDGVHYHFKTIAEFEAGLAADAFVEHTHYTGKDYYGTPRAALAAALRPGGVAILKIEFEGAFAVREALPEAVLVFVAPASLDELAGRLRQRPGAETADIERRLRRAEMELNEVPGYDYLIVNGNGELDEATDRLEAIITAERCRVRPRLVHLPDA